MQVVNFQLIAVHDYIEGELRSEVRHEYVNGNVVAMVGASRSHNLIAGELFSALNRHLRDHNKCRAYMSDMKVRIETASDDKFYYPDVMVSCDPEPPSEFFETRPSLIAEVLSESTAMRDRLEKHEAYLQIPELKEYLLIEQDRISAEVFRRENGSLSRQLLSDGDRLNLLSVGFSIPLNDIYRKLVSTR